MTTRIAFIGFGEVGTVFARGFGAAPAVRIAAYDIKHEDPAAAPELRDRAGALGVFLAGTAAEAVAGADLVISAVTASAAEPVARAVASSLPAAAVFFDVNSAAPSTKRRAAVAVEAAGVAYVEGAVMAPVAEPGLRVPILAGGRRAADLAERLNALGMNITPVSEVIGRASATKLCRSIVVKGLEALMIDCAAAAREFGVADDVFASLSQSFGGLDFAKLADTMAARVARHGVRRAAEMEEAAEMLADAGFDPGLSRAIAAAQLRGARRPG